MSSSEARVPVAPDQTRARTVLLNQLLLGAVVSFTAIMILVTGHLDDQRMLVAGLTVVIVGCGCALLVPWNRLPHWSGLVLPVADIIAISVLRESSSSAGFGILWAFPGMWLAGSFGLAGLIGGVSGIAGLYWVAEAINARHVFSAVTLLLPISIAALSTIAYLTARRSLAQRIVLDRQSQFLQNSLARARRQEDLVTEILEAVDFGVIRITTAGGLLVSNDAHARLLRRPTDAEMMVYAADGTTEIAEGLDPLSRARRGEVFEHEVFWYGSPVEGGRALSATARPLRDIDGSPAGIVLVTGDVTAEERAVRAREDLIASVSHELRTPLTSIMGYLDLALDSDELGPESRARLEVVERNATRLLQIVADILSASARTRAESTMVVSPEQVDVAPVVRAAIEAASAAAAERRITITGGEAVNVEAFVDAHRIRQVLDNLISNAIKYNADGGRVEVDVTRDGLFTWISVSDDGPGIPSDELPRLFERFFRSDSVRNTGTHGSGLGLAISRDIVRAHGGEITVRTALGSGTEFLVRLLSADPREDS